MDLKEVSNILGGRKILGRELNTRMDLVELGREGITKDAVVHLSQFTHLPLPLVLSILPVSERSLQRYSHKKHLNSTISEQVLQITEVVARGIEVLGNKDKAMKWLERPNVALGNVTPFSLLKSRFGVEMVLDVLGRIESGVYS